MDFAISSSRNVAEVKFGIAKIERKSSSIEKSENGVEMTMLPNQGQYNLD
jgi:hypothetical protein